MSDANNRRLSVQQRAKDIAILEVLRGIAGYDPANADIEVAALNAEQTSMEGKQESEVQAEGTWRGMRDDSVIAEKLFHEHILQAVDAVKSQYGENSNEYQALGRKKKSERKSPKRKPTA